MLPGLLALAGLGLFAALVAVGYVGYGLVYAAIGLWKGGEWLVQRITRRREARVARIEAELDRQQDEMRREVLQLATALGMEAHEARQALIRESYLASDVVPDSER